MPIRRKSRHRHRSSIDDFDFYHEEEETETTERDEDDEEELITTSKGNKRIKLDSLLSDFHLNDIDEDNSGTNSSLGVVADIPQLVDDNGSDDKGVTTDKYVINKNIQSFQFIKDLSDNGSSMNNINDLNQYFSHKLLNEYQQYIESNLKMIRWYNYRFLIVYKFQNWCLKLFNRFIRKFNHQNQLKIPKFNHYDKVLNLIHEKKLSLNDYVTILNNENNIDMAKLKDRQRQRKLKLRKERLQNDHKDEDEWKDIKYNYWDTLKFDIDVDVDLDEEARVRNDHSGEAEDDDEDRKIVELPNEIDPGQDQYYHQYSSWNSDMDID